MLTPEYLQNVPDAMVELYAQAENDILADMARRINGFDMFIPSAQYQMQVLEEMGALRSDILAKLGQLTGKSQKELAAIMKEAGMKSLAADEAIYKAAGLSSSPAAASAAVKEALTAGLKKTNGLFTNLTKTTANTATKQFENALDRAYMAVTSGAIDQTNAVKGAIKNLAKEGVASIKYPTGHVDSIEVAVRRAAVTGVNQTCLNVQEARADELGADLVETTAHAGARPSHAVWQGQVFSRSGKSSKYPDFRMSTGYGTGAGLGGWNCSHSFRPYIEGMPRAYSKDLLDDYAKKEYTYNGQTMTEYEALQQQRAIERKIRQYKRETSALNAVNMDAGESASKLQKWQNTQKDFISQTGLKRQASRESIAGWGKSEARKATWTVKKTAAGVANTGNNGIISSGKTALPTGKSFPALDKDGYRELRKAAGKISSADLKTLWDGASGYIQTGNSWTINSAMRSSTVNKLPAASQNTVSVLRSVIDQNKSDRDFLAVRYADSNYLQAVFGPQVSKLNPAAMAKELKANYLGQVIEEKSFVSVSMDEAKNVFTYKPVKLKVEIPTGTNVYASSNFQESEAIMKDGLRYILRDAQIVNNRLELTVRVIE